jgi:uncharacterized membrane protein (DUF2068 family)
MKRPGVFTFIAVLSFWTAVATLALDPIARSNVATTASGILLSVSSAVAGIAIWRCVRWAHYAFLVSAVTAIIYLSAHHFALGKPSQGFWLGQVAVGVVLSAIVYRYMRIQLASRG